MTLTQLRYLVAIADSGLNITQAAERVHATQPGLSKQLKQLEDELGFQLFIRKGRSLDSVAPAGGKVIEHARRVLAETANIRSYAANERGEHSGRLLLATTHTQARYVLPPVIAAIKRDFPRVNVDLLAAGDSEVLGALDQADLALISTAGSEPQGGVAVPLFRWRRVLLVQDTHPLAALKRSADPGRTRRPSIDQLRVLDARGLVVAACVRRRGVQSADRDDRARRQPDQDVCACRPWRRPACGNGDRHARGR